MIQCSIYKIQNNNNILFKCAIEDTNAKMPLEEKKYEDKTLSQLTKPIFSYIENLISEKTTVAIIFSEETKTIHHELTPWLCLPLSKEERAEFWHYYNIASSS